jgi:quinoprotein relay system zinc metallohydrolase 2
MPKLWMSLLLSCLVNGVQAAPLPVMQAAPGIYVHHGVHEELDVGYHGDICNIGFIVGNKGVAIIDSGGSLAVGKRLRESVRQVTDLPILYVINTHVHPDHIFGNAAFLVDKPAYVGHHKLADAMERRREIYLRNNAAWLGADAAGSEIVKPTQPVESTLEIDLGDRKLLLTAYPVSHTNTDLTVLDTTTASLWSGDLLFVERTPSIDGDIKGWLQTIEKLRQVPAQRIVPGHGAVASDWGRALDNEQRYLKTLLNDVRTSIRKGEFMERAMDTAAASEQGNWKLFQSVNRRNVNIVYPALEWE